MTQSTTGWLQSVRQSHGTRLAAALVDCRLGSLTNATESFQEIADRHGVDPYDLCTLWLDDPTRPYAADINAAAICEGAAA
ncbi:hypothetical protein JVX98_28195 [Ensifer sp. PDNC004]|uniref:hypothetical protein n=1 Tax=Ensifer sp. PDNC004 TaxID=2811423 RepID=UPI001966AE4B|nr:hypothetical protein [Ensifer sp. PDNC004]QRY68172.1 hypothetical protein JVX98_28195 [Ensifer sp. PDNC004]